MSTGNEMKANPIKQMLSLMYAQQKAERDGRNEFECPLCGETAWWSRSEWNNHLRCWCTGCGFQIME